MRRANALYTMLSCPDLSYVYCSWSIHLEEPSRERVLRLDLLHSHALGSRDDIYMGTQCKP